MPSYAMCAATNSPQVYRLSLTGSYPDSHPAVAGVLLPWAREIDEKTNGRVIITYYNPDTLFPESMHFEAVRKGNAAMAHQLCGLSKNSLAVSGVMRVPSALNASQEASAALWRLYRNSPELQNEYADIKLLALHTTAPLQLHTNFPVKKISDLKNKKILCPDNDTAAMLGACGAIALVTPMREWQQDFASLSADGAAAPFDMFGVYNLARLPVTYSRQVDLSVMPCWLGMNKNEWEALPRDCRQIIEAASGEKLSLKIAQALDNACKNTQNTLAQNGLRMQKQDAAEAEEWRLALEPAAKEAWLAQMKSANIDNGEKILERARRIYKTVGSTYIVGDGS